MSPNPPSWWLTKWVRAHAAEVAMFLPVGQCDHHHAGEETEQEKEWGQSGHIWLEGHDQRVKLCLPKKEHR